MIQTIKEIEEQYKDEWVLVEVVTSDSNGWVVQGKVLAHSKNKQDTYDAMRDASAKDIAHFFNGPPDPNYVYAL